MNRRLTMGFVALSVALACAGCSSSSDESDSPPAAAASASAAPDEATASDSSDSSEADAADSGGSDFCTLYATQVAQTLANIQAVEEGGIAKAESIADDLVEQAPVSGAELQAAAPPEPLGYLQAMADADTSGASGDFSALEDTFTNLTKLNDWAIANCDSQYSSVFADYKEVVG